MTHLWLMPTKPIEAIPIPEPSFDCRAFHSDDAAQLAEWLRAGRGPTCRNDAALVDEVRMDYIGRSRRRWWQNRTAAKAIQYLRSIQVRRLYG